MTLNFPTYKISHILALATTVILHGGILASTLLPSDPIILDKQTIHVSFVAPSAPNKPQEKAKILDKKSPKKLAELQKKQTASTETVGRVDENSKALSSLESEAIFDAAYLNNPAPKYPSFAKKRNIEGKVILEVAVNSEGRADRVAVSHSSGFAILDNAALEAVKTWRFIPAKKAGKAIAALVLVPVEFKII